MTVLDSEEQTGWPHVVFLVQAILAVQHFCTVLEKEACRRNVAVTGGVAQRALWNLISCQLHGQKGSWQCRMRCRSVQLLVSFCNVWCRTGHEKTESTVCPDWLEDNNWAWDCRTSL
ncbi:hypothetical protein BJX66DRAFT_305454 [Aspergillus keveii]|uniref:Uncharacterized protein n=1 Tax=Aspergillus keveii TaxID=714993 RepID=A0ABR4G3R3_9EURO